MKKKPPDLIVRPSNETELRRDVIQLARSAGWAPYYTHYSPYSTPGWPDLALVRPPVVVLAELKTARGKLRPAQEDTDYLLRSCRRVEYRLWRPEDLGADVLVTLGVEGRIQGRLL